MNSLALCVLATGLLVSASGMAAENPQQASLHFVSKDTVLIGVSYGLNSVDGQSLLPGQRASTKLAAGRRTVRYTCPYSPASAVDQVAVIDVAPGEQYELVCRIGQPALVRSGGC